METILKMRQRLQVSWLSVSITCQIESVIVRNVEDKVVMNLNFAIIQYHILLGMQAEWLERLTANAKVATVPEPEFEKF